MMCDADSMSAVLNTLVKFNVIGNEAKRNVVRSLAKGAGVDPLAVFKAGSTPVHAGEIKEDGKWVSLRVKVIQLWDSTSDKITQIKYLPSPEKRFSLCH